MIASNTAFCALACITRYSAVSSGIRRYLAVFDGIWRYLAVFGGIWRYLEGIAQLPLTTRLILREDLNIPIKRFLKQN